MRYRNERMTADQSVIGKRCNYYDQIGGEATIYNHSTAEAIAEQAEDQPHEFSEAEKEIIRLKPLNCVKSYLIQ